MKIGVIIPAFDEQLTVGRIVQRSVQALAQVGEGRIVVSDNQSNDLTAAVARAAGAEVVFSKPRGYGKACLCAVDHLGDWPDILLFLDADGSSRPEEIDLLLRDLREDRADLVLGKRPAGSPMTLPQKWGTWLATRLIALRWGRDFEDMGPFRAIRRNSFQRLGMQDPTWGWTVEMQILGVLHGLRIEEVPVSWEQRLAGDSKISGSLTGVVRAGTKILWTIAKYWNYPRQQR